MLRISNIKWWNIIRWETNQENRNIYIKMQKNEYESFLEKNIINNFLDIVTWSNSSQKLR